MDDVAIYTEMGRYPWPFGALVAQCIHRKHTYKEYAGSGLPAPAGSLMRPATCGAYHHITVLGKENALCDVPTM